jgi:hypothetical protein
MKQTILHKSVCLFLISLFFASDAYARGGGGGSGSGGGEGSVIGLPIVIIIVIYALYKRRKMIKQAKTTIEKAQQTDRAWDEDLIKKRVSDVFYAFQKDWSEFNVENMKSYLTDQYLKRMVLEMAVLKNMHRRNEMIDPNLKNVVILEASDSLNNDDDYFLAEITAQAHDKLIDETTGNQLYADSKSFTEYWRFVRNGNIWKLSLISQVTEEEALIEKDISDFSARNNFFYDPDFGWLMMPNRGAIFRKTNFKRSDINNHVIGYFRDKIVEFYTYIPVPGNNGSSGTFKWGKGEVPLSNFLGGDQQYSIGYKNYVVAQAILPINYRDILIKKKHWLFNFSPRGLRRIHTESNDFERKFCLWADPSDQVSSFELLAPNFMEKIYALPFELNIEVVDNVLYFYVKSRKEISYDKLLEILSWAFDEMKM